MMATRFRFILPFYYRTALETRRKIFNKKPRRIEPSGAWKFPVRSTLRELETFARARLAVFLALFHARIAREQALGLQRAPQGRVKLQQRPGNAMPHRAGLAVRPAAADIDARVEFFHVAGDGQRLCHSHPQGFERKIAVERAAVDGDLAAAGRETHPGHGGLAPAGAEIFGDLDRKSVV